MMGTKRGALDTLDRAGLKVPTTFWSLREAIQEISPRDPRQWYVRSDASDGDRRHELPQRALAYDELTRLTEASADYLFVQEYVAAHSSGVLAMTPSWFLNEAVIGTCSPLLRDGAVGQRTALPRAVEGQEWEAGAHLGLSQAARQVASIAGAASLPQFTLLEWVASVVGEVTFVDLKHLPTGYTELKLFPRPKVFELGTSARELAAHEVPTTNLAYLDPVIARGSGRVRCRSGSPLAHFNVELQIRGISLDVPNE